MSPESLLPSVVGNLPLILYGRCDGATQFFRSTEGEVDVPQYFASHEHDVCLSFLDYVIGLCGIGDEADGADDDVLDVLLDMSGEGKLCENAQRRSDIEVGGRDVR